MKLLRNKLQFAWKVPITKFSLFVDQPFDACMVLDCMVHMCVCCCYSYMNLISDSSW